MTQVRVRYKDSADGLVVQLIHTWHRTDWEIARGYDMSASGGPKETTTNWAIAVFSRDPAIDAISYVYARGLAFFIMRRGRQHFDITGREVSAERVNPSAGRTAA